MAKQRDESDDLRFPLQGLDLSTGFNAQRPGTTSVGQNVRSYDAGSLRKRGGSRAGLTPFFGVGSTAQVDGFALVQHLNCIVSVNINATFKPQPPPLQSIHITMDYQITFGGNVYNAPTHHEPVVSWNPTTTMLRTFDSTPFGTTSPHNFSGVTGEIQYQLTSDGTTTFLVATLNTLGLSFDPSTLVPISGVVNSSLLDSSFFVPTSTPFTGSFAATSNDVSAVGALLVLSFSVQSL